MSMVDPRNPIAETQEASPYKDDGTTVSPEINLKSVEFLHYFDLKDEMFNRDVMEKIDYLADRMELEDLRRLDLSLGMDGTPRIDKIYMHEKLLDQERQIREEEQLIREQRRRLML